MPMDPLADSPQVSLLPVPWKFAAQPGICPVGPNSPLRIDAGDRRVEGALANWRSRLERVAGGAGDRREAPVTVALDRGVCTDPQGYLLTVGVGGVCLVGGSPGGCFYGVQTLRQLAAVGGNGLPCCRIEDRPDFATRGLLHDVTRGKVPRLETLMLLADRLAGLKVNQLQLNIEHAFVFSFDREICGPDDGLTPDEVGKLDRYCRDRFIDLVPAVATLGHMGRILSMPRYRHLAEIEAPRPWATMSWPQRLRGLTLNCLDPEAHRLVENVWSEILEAFSGPVVNICGDEPWDLGKGRSRDRLGELRKGEAYVAHLRRTHDLCAGRGRRTQLWSDVVRGYPHLLGHLPGDTAILHWGYDDRADYEGTALFTGTGLTTFVCPGTSGWKRILNAMDLAERNVSTFAAAGIRHGAAGLINTDWGDHGHFNLLACSWHGIAVGAACGWNAAHPTGAAFDEAFARLILGVSDAKLVQLLRDASAIAGTSETWRLLWMPIAELLDDQSVPAYDQLRQVARAAAEVRRRCGAASAMAGEPRDLGELALAGGFTELLAEKLDFLHQRRAAGGWSSVDRRARARWADRVGQIADDYGQAWTARNKPSGLADILAAVCACAQDIRGGTGA